MKNLKIRLTAAALLGSMVLSGSLSGCSKKQNNNQGEIDNTKIVVVEDDNEKLQKELIALFPHLSQDIIKNTSLIIMLDELIQKDENGKISSTKIANYKAKIDTNNMMNDFNSFLNELEHAMYNDSLVSVSDLVIAEDKEILSKIEKITDEIIKGMNIKINFDLISKLIVEEDEITYDGLTFKIRDLSYSGRAIANTYARVINNYSKGSVDESKRQLLDERTNNQNNKAYIKTILEILSNQMNEKSKVDVISLFEKEYTITANTLNNKVETENVKNLVNYMNLEYLDSDKVSNKDKNTLLGEYSEFNIENVIITIDAITSYNRDSFEILFSNMLIDEYKNEETGKIDKLALDYVQFNSYMFLNTTTYDMDKEELCNNPYFKNLYKYFTKQNFEQKSKDGEIVNICHQNISDGAKLIANEMVYYTFNERANIYLLEGYEEVVKNNLEESIQYVQNTITGECEKADAKELFK